MAEFNIAAISIKAQRKLASSLSTRKTVRLILDERANCLLDKAFRVLLCLAASRKDAERVMKDVIKLVVKTGLLARHDQFTTEEAEAGRQLRPKFRNLVMAVSSFHRVDYSYDRRFLLDLLDACQRLLQSLLRSHLTDKSRGRLDRVFQFFHQPQVLDSMFLASSGSTAHTAVGQLCRELDEFVDSGII